ncbi:MAG: hypothetical protein WBV55_16140 [Candidatus Sulfotelmatobacter sp.]
MLLGVEGGEHYGLVVHFGGVLVDGGGGLGAEVAVAGIEVERGDVVSAVRAGKLHAAFDASDGVEAFHKFECSLLRGDEKARGWGSEGNQEGVRAGSILGTRLPQRLKPFLEIWFIAALKRCATQTPGFVAQERIATGYSALASLAGPFGSAQDRQLRAAIPA